jgi:hypothetical protein
MKSSAYHQLMLIIGSLLVIIGALLMSLPAFSQDDGFIYRGIHTEDEKVYEASHPLEEKIYWTDFQEQITHRCTVELRNGKKINLAEGQDVSELNQEMLVFVSGKNSPCTCDGMK